VVDLDRGGGAFMTNMLSAEDVSKVTFGDTLGKMIVNGMDVNTVCTKLREVFEQAIYRIKKVYNQRFAQLRHRMATRKQDLSRRGVANDAIEKQIRSEFMQEMHTLQAEQDKKIQDVRMMIRTIIDEAVRRFAKIEHE